MAVACALVLAGCGAGDTPGPDTGAAGGTLAENDWFDTEDYLGRTVTVSATVATVLGPQAFLLAGEDDGDDTFLVLSRDTPRELSAGEDIQVTGTVRRFHYDTLADRMGWTSQRDTTPPRERYSSTQPRSTRASTMPAHNNEPEPRSSPPAVVTTNGATAPTGPALAAAGPQGYRDRHQSARADQARSQRDDMVRWVPGQRIIEVRETAHRDTVDRAGRRARPQLPLG